MGNEQNKPQNKPEEIKKEMTPEEIKQEVETIQEEMELLANQLSEVVLPEMTEKELSKVLSASRVADYLLASFIRLNKFHMLSTGTIAETAGSKTLVKTQIDTDKNVDLTIRYSGKGWKKTGGSGNRTNI